MLSEYFKKHGIRLKNKTELKNFFSEKEVVETVDQYLESAFTVKGTNLLTTFSASDWAPERPILVYDFVSPKYDICGRVDYYYAICTYNHRGLVSNQAVYFDNDMKRVTESGRYFSDDHPEGAPWWMIKESEVREVANTLGLGEMIGKPVAVLVPVPVMSVYDFKEWYWYFTATGRGKTQEYLLSPLIANPNPSFNYRADVPVAQQVLENVQRYRSWVTVPQPPSLPRDIFAELQKTAPDLAGLWRYDGENEKYVVGEGTPLNEILKIHYWVWGKEREAFPRIAPVTSSLSRRHVATMIRFLKVFCPAEPLNLSERIQKKKADTSYNMKFDTVNILFPEAVLDMQPRE